MHSITWGLNLICFSISCYDTDNWMIIPPTTLHKWGFPKYICIQEYCFSFKDGNFCKFTINYLFSWWKYQTKANAHSDFQGIKSESSWNLASKAFHDRVTWTFLFFKDNDISMAQIYKMVWKNALLFIENPIIYNIHVKAPCKSLVPFY